LLSGGDGLEKCCSDKIYNMSYDKRIAEKIIGKYILIGISYIDPEGKLESQQQLHGIVERASEDDGIIVALSGVYKGEKLGMEPDTSSIVPADPGVYQLHSSGEEIENPDYLCTWKVQK
jgi:hypothetical protein